MAQKKLRLYVNRKFYMKSLLFVFLLFCIIQPSYSNHSDLYTKFKKELANELSIKNKLDNPEKKNNIYYFISFSMRDEAIDEIMRLSHEYRIPVYINGLINDSMKDTTYKFVKLFGEKPEFGIGIDPNLFQKYNITSVPVLIVECDSKYDKITGNIPIYQALEKVAQNGDCSSIAKKVLENRK